MRDGSGWRRMGGRLNAAARRLQREPLVLFALLGALTYGASQWLESRRLEIPASRFDEAANRMQAFLAAPALQPSQRREADARVLADELLYREALRLGLDRDDAVIRQHLAQKLLLLNEELRLAGRTPAEPELRALYREMSAAWTDPPRVSFCQVYSRSPDMARVGERLRRQSADCPADAGDAFALGHEFPRWAAAEVAGSFGADFARQVEAAPLGAWIGPVTSRFGWHLLRVTERLGARTPSFEQQQGTLLALWSQRERDGARQELLRRLAAEYRTTVDRGASPQMRERVAQAAATLSR